MSIQDRNITVSNPALIQALFGGLDESAQSKNIRLDQLNSQQLLTLDTTIEQLLKNLKGADNGLKDALELGSSQAASTARVLDTLSGEELRTDVFAVLAAFSQMTRAMRASGKLELLHKNQQEQTDSLNAAEKMKIAAAERLTSALVQGVMQIVSGMVQLGFQAFALRYTIESAKLDLEAKTQLANIAKGEKLSNLTATEVADQTILANTVAADATVHGSRGQLLTAAGQASSSLAGGLGSAVGGHNTKRADDAAYEQTTLDIAAKKLATEAAQINELLQHLLELIRDVRETLKALQQMTDDSNRAIVRNI